MAGWGSYVRKIAPGLFSKSTSKKCGILRCVFLFTQKLISSLETFSNGCGYWYIISAN